ATLAGGSHAPHTSRTFPGNHRSFADGERYPECRRGDLSLVCQLPGSLHLELRLHIPETVLSDGCGLWRIVYAEYALENELSHPHCVVVLQTHLRLVPS